MAELYQAIVKRKPLATLTALMKKTKDLNYVSPSGHSILDVVLFRIENNHPSRQDKFNKEVNENKSDNNNSDPHLNYTEVLRQLLNHGIDASRVSPEAVRDITEPDLIRKLIQNGMPLDVQDRQGMSLLMYYVLSWSELDTHRAARENDLRQDLYRVIQVLLENDADATLPSRDGSTLLHLILSGSMTRDAHALLTRILPEFDVNVEDNKGRTPLMYFLTRPNWSMEQDEVPLIQVVDLLISKGADILHRNSSGKSAKDIAREQNDRELVHMMEEIESRARQGAQGTLISRTKKGPLYGITPAIAKKITNFLGGKRTQRTHRRRRHRTHRRRTHHRR